jgi:hypothetical protein
VSSYLLVTNTLIYFVSTAQVLASEIKMDRAMLRLQLIFQSSDGLSLNVGSFLELFNAIQVLASIIFVILLSFFFYKYQINKNLSKTR